MAFLNKILLTTIAAMAMLFGLIPKDSTICLSSNGGVEIEYNCECNDSQTSCCVDENDDEHREHCKSNNCIDTEIQNTFSIQSAKIYVIYRASLKMSNFWDFISKQSLIDCEKEKYVSPPYLFTYSISDISVTIAETHILLI